MARNCLAGLSSSAIGWPSRLHPGCQRSNPVSGYPVHLAHHRQRPCACNHRRRIRCPRRRSGLFAPCRCNGYLRQRIYDTPTVTFAPLYDSFARVTTHEITQNGSESINYTYSYDDNGNIISKIFEHRTSDPANIYSYDSLDRVTKSGYHNGENEQFVLDGLGNSCTV